jgi:hypothetical protein
MRSYKFKITNSSDDPGEFLEEVYVIVASADGEGYTDDDLIVDTEFVITMMETLQDWYHANVDFVGTT